ncbi:hypothetical protein CJ030_MR0G002589 [Morella rubra]|uniref:Uncharacterized protein n=1 Tax=Morella rubra TaxID=262757 RepID=A0A6A1UMJ2_9ROSI|nr:hypothetical protein CJ030_MR0G002589 [Morella rubra]
MQSDPQVSYINYPRKAPFTFIGGLAERLATTHHPSIGSGHFFGIIRMRSVWKVEKRPLFWIEESMTTRHQAKGKMQKQPFIGNMQNESQANPHPTRESSRPECTTDHRLCNLENNIAHLSPYMETMQP